MREVVVDTETTGLDVLAGHRVIEIGCVELVNYVPTGRTWQTYLNPGRPNEREAYEVHGLSDQFLARQPRFRDVVADFAAFLDDSSLVIHNASFDLGFLNNELGLTGHDRLSGERIVDTLELARRAFPGQPNSLDALMRRFQIDASARTKHGALLDAELLARVYLELRGGRQQGLGLAGPAAESAAGDTPGDGAAAPGTPVRDARPHEASPPELQAHRKFLDQVSDPIWLRQA